MLTRAVGFRYAYNKAVGQYAHASGIMVVTPDGRLSRYFYGIEYGPRDLTLALIESADRKIGSPVDQLLLACFHYDPSSGKYSLAVMRMVRTGRRGDAAGHWRDRRDDAKAGAERATPVGRRALASARRSTTPREHMAPSIQFFPEQASTLASRVDNLYFFMLATSGFFAVLVIGAGRLLRHQVPPASPGRARRADPWIAGARARSGRASPSSSRW